MRIVELHLAPLGKKSDLNTNFPHTELPGISKCVLRDGLGSVGRVLGPDSDKISPCWRPPSLPGNGGWWEGVGGCLDDQQAEGASIALRSQWIFFLILDFVSVEIPRHLNVKENWGMSLMTDPFEDG